MDTHISIGPSTAADLRRALHATDIALRALSTAFDELTFCLVAFYLDLERALDEHPAGADRDDIASGNVWPITDE